MSLVICIKMGVNYIHTINIKMVYASCFIPVVFVIHMCKTYIDVKILM